MEKEVAQPHSYEAEPGAHRPTSSAQELAHVPAVVEKLLDLQPDHFLGIHRRLPAYQVGHLAMIGQVLHQELLTLRAIQRGLLSPDATLPGLKVLGLPPRLYNAITRANDIGTVVALKEALDAGESLRNIGPKGLQIIGAALKPYEELLQLYMERLT